MTDFSITNPVKPSVVTPVATTPSDALQTAKAINTALPSAYLFTARALVNGVDLGPPIQYQVSANNYYQADRYCVELALSAMPKGYDAAYWSDGDQKKIELRCKMGDLGEKTLIVGLIDDSEINWLTKVLALRGRDLTSLLIDNKTGEKFQNKTSSQIAALLAARHGLQTKITDTSALVGIYYQREHVQLTSDITEHDLLTYLAEQEGFNYWIEGSTLHFEAPPPAPANPYVVLYANPTATTIANGNFISLTTKRNETLAKDIKVVVVSWNGKQKNSITATATRARAKSSSKVTGSTAGGGVAATRYVIRSPGLNIAQAQDLANKEALELSKNERSLVVNMPYDPVLDARSRISLRGTQTPFDQPYYIDAIEYSADFESGSRMEINCRNSAPSSQVTVG